MNRILIGGLSGLAGGALYGAIGAGVGQKARNPVLKGALVSGVVGGTLSTLIMAVAVSNQPEQQQLSSGTAPSPLPSGSTAGVYFP